MVFVGFNVPVSVGFFSVSVAVMVTVSDTESEGVTVPAPPALDVKSKTMPKQ